MWIFSSLSLFCALVAKSFGECTPDEKIAMNAIDLADGHNTVVYFGMVTATYTDPRFPVAPGANPDTYIARTERHCTLRGPKDLPSSINVTNAGHLPGRCYDIPMHVGSDYLIFMTLDRQSEMSDALVLKAAMIESKQHHCEIVLAYQVDPIYSPTIHPGIECFTMATCKNDPEFAAITVRTTLPTTTTTMKAMTVAKREDNQQVIKPVKSNPEGNEAEKMPADEATYGNKAPCNFMVWTSIVVMSLAMATIESISFK